LVIFTLSIQTTFYTPEKSLEEQKIPLQVTRIPKASQNVLFIGGHIDQLHALENMAERRSRDEL
jgi:hypothetical protein